MGILQSEEGHYRVKTDPTELKRETLQNEEILQGEEISNKDTLYSRDTTRGWKETAADAVEWSDECE